MDVQALLQAPDRALGKPCLIAGAEWVRLEECRDALRLAARQAGFDQIEQLDAAVKSFDWIEVAQISVSPGLFATRRVLDLRLGSAKLSKPAQQILTEILERADPDLQLLVSLPEWSRQVEAEGWIKSFSRVGRVYSMWPLKPAEVSTWLAAKAQRGGIQLDREALELLLWRTDGNLLAATQELQKLALARPQARWTAAALDEHVADSARFDVFRLTDEALYGNALQMRRVLRTLRAEGDHPARMMGPIIRQLEIMVGLAQKLQEGQAAALDWLRSERVFDPRAGRLIQAASRHGVVQWERLWMEMREVDRATKGHSALTPWLALERLLMRVALPTRMAERFAA